MASASKNNAKWPNNSVPRDILDDVSSRFIVNMPEVERRDPIRVCFQAEEAHWFYMDFYCANQQFPNCKSIGVREFIRLVFWHCDFLRRHQPHVDEIINKWREYKSRVPTYGACIFNQDATKILLVQGFYAKNSWGFPKGKVNEAERADRCAMREVLEEVGLDISPIIDTNVYLDRMIGETSIRLYIIRGVTENTKFLTQTRNEIKHIRWFKLCDLPDDKYDMSKTNLGFFPNHFYTVTPFVKDLNSWVRLQFPTPVEGRISEGQMRTNKRGKKQTMAMHFSKQARNVPPRLEQKLSDQPEASGGLLNNLMASASGYSGASGANPSISPNKKIIASNNNIPYAKSWTNFHLDVDEIMKHAMSAFDVKA